ncbi:MAG: helix-turn-helix domain containing protein [Myxococcales bacterium]|nr:helix-turn-helix domain containing protein [Myxococcales bacterium]
MLGADSEAGTPGPDGRHRRRERSRALIVDSALALLHEHGRLPSARAVAERAGLTERTLFNLFEDKDALMLAALSAFRQEALARMPTVEQGCALQERVRRFFEALAPLMDDYARMRWAAATSSAEVPDLERRVVLRTLHRRVFELFELSGTDLRASPVTAAAVRAAVDPLTWRIYRVQQRLSISASRDAMMNSVLALSGAR